MSMLAERKRKQKWSLNPRGKFWSEDSNKFGQKMLEKMGWSNGKGLGRNENGIVEHVKIPYKNDSKGMGYKERDDQWTEHETNFGNLLKALTKDTETTVSKVEIKSLEEKAQKSKVRVHYHKFTRGKDLSKYSMKDLANIFGKKSLNINNEEEQVDNNEQIESNSNFFYTGQSSVDYFNKKLQNSNKMDAVQSRERSNSESETRVGFGFKTSEEPNKLKETFVSYINGGVKDCTNLKRKYSGDIELEPQKKKKKSKSENKKISDETLGLSNPAFDPNHSNVVIEKHVLNTIVESFEEENSGTSLSHETEDSKKMKKKKIKKQKIFDESGILNPALEDTNFFTESTLCDDSLAINQSEEIPKKKKKIKQNEESFGADNSCLTLNETQNNESVPNGFEVKRKDKKKKKLNNNINKDLQQTDTNCGLDNLALHVDEENNKKNSIESPISNEFEVKRKNRKRKNIDISTNDGIKNPVLEINDLESNDVTGSPITSEFEVKRKIKTSKKKNTDENIENVGLDNLALKINDVDNNESSCSSIINEFEVKRKTKNSKKKNSCKNIQEDLGLDNLALKINDGDTRESASISGTNDFEVKRKIKKEKKIKKNNELGVDNSALNLSDTNTESINAETSAIESDLMFNIVSTPIIKKTEDKSSTKGTSSVKRRKSVRFNDVTQEHIIPNKDDSQDTNLTNELDYDIHSKIISNDLKEKKHQKANFKQRMNSISQKLDGCEAEVENDINEAKLKTVEMEDMMIGEVGNPDGESEGHPEGSLLKFKNVKFGRTPGYMQNVTGPKKAYKKLIKGDIIVKFQNSNLHEIVGYATGNK